VKKAVESKLYYLHHNPNSFSHSIYDRLIFNKIKMVFGGRLRIMVTGSAPI